ncbi:MAG: hypothetical protein RIR48_2443, partial [Bacteroidota bacterium]
MKSLYSGVTCLFITFWLSAHHTALCQAKPLNYQIEAREFLNAIRNKENTDLYIKIFNDCTVDQLNGQISTDQQKLAFWINIYNAYIQVILS